MRTVSRIVIVSVIISLSFSFCRKNKGEPQPEQVQNLVPNPPPPDQIVYTAISPNYTVVETDSCLLDIDGNSTMDYLIQSIKYWKPSNSPHVPGGTWLYSVKARGTNTLNLVRGSSDWGRNDCVDSGIVINGSMTPSYNPSGFLYDQFSAINFTGVKYLPIQLNSQYFGWIKVEGFSYIPKIVVKEMAVNMASGNSIKAGQKQ